MPVAAPTLVLHSNAVPRSFPPEQSPYDIVMVDVTHRCNMTCANCYLPNRVLPDIDARFSDQDLEFLYEHMTVDDRHGEEGAQLIASVATTDELRRQALEGARRGGSGWWQILLKHARHAPVPA